MHYIVRDVAIRTSKKSGFFCQSGILLYEMPQKYQNSFARISFLNDKITRLPSLLIGCSELTVLLLQDNSLKKIPKNFFREVRALKSSESKQHIDNFPASFA